MLTLLLAMKKGFYHSCPQLLWFEHDGVFFFLFLEKFKIVFNTVLNFSKKRRKKTKLKQESNISSGAPDLI